MTSLAFLVLSTPFYQIKNIISRYFTKQIFQIKGNIMFLCANNHFFVGNTYLCQDKHKMRNP